MTDHIVVRDLRVKSRVGAEGPERSTPQWVRLTIDVSADLSKAGASDDLADTIDYGSLITEVCAFVASRESHLLEHLAEEVAAFVARKPGARGVTVEVVKESPPIAEDVGGVAIRVERSGQ